MRNATSLALLALLWAATPATAQSPDAVRGGNAQPYSRAVAAGYKAAFLCAGLFNAGRSEASVETLDLRGIYPDYDDIVPRLAAKLDRASASVTVMFDARLPPRRATWRRGEGCTLSPIGAGTPMAMARYATPPGPAPAPSAGRR